MRRRLMYLSFQGLRAAMGVLPFGAAQALGRLLGWIAYAALRSQRQTSLRHLEYALGPSMAAGSRRRIARGVFVNLGQNAMEWLRLPALSLNDVQRLVSAEGLEHLRVALAEGNGAIVIGAHFGNWEVVPLYLKSLGFEGGVLARRLRYPEYEAFLIALRGAKGVPTIARGSMKDVAKMLRANQIVGVMPDQDIDSLDGVFINFFGHPAYTPAGPAALSLMTGAPILPCFLLRDGGRFRLVIEPALKAAPTCAPPTGGAGRGGSDRVQAITALTQAWSDVVERYIRRHPDHWVWMHRRWKTQPSVNNAQGSGLRAQGNSPEPPALSPQPTVSPRQPVLAVIMIGCWLSLSSMLGGCAKSRDATSEGRVPAEGSDSTQHMDQLTGVAFTSEGTKPVELQGTQGSLEGSLVTIQQPDVVSHQPERTVYVKASLGQYDLTTRRVRLEHEATIHTSDGLWITSPTMYWLPDLKEFATDQPVRLETDHMLLRGREALGHTEMKQVTILHDIELVLNPTDHDTPTADPAQVTITCDGPLAFDYEKNIATFEQNVHVKDPNGDLYSDKLVAYLDQATRTIRYAEATGRVRIHQHQNTALSERAIYEPAIGKITLVGKPSLLVYPSTAGGNAPLTFSGLKMAPTAERSGKPSAPAQTAADSTP